MFQGESFFASLIVYLPKVAMPPCTAALFSSAVPDVRLLDANLETSALQLAKHNGHHYQIS